MESTQRTFQSKDSSITQPVDWKMNSASIQGPEFAKKSMTLNRSNTGLFYSSNAKPLKLNNELNFYKNRNPKQQTDSSNAKDKYSKKYLAMMGEKLMKIERIFHGYPFHSILNHSKKIQRKQLEEEIFESSKLEAKKTVQLPSEDAVYQPLLATNRVSLKDDNKSRQSVSLTAQNSIRKENTRKEKIAVVSGQKAHDIPKINSLNLKALERDEQKDEYKVQRAQPRNIDFADLPIPLGQESKEDRGDHTRGSSLLSQTHTRTPEVFQPTPLLSLVAKKNIDTFFVEYEHRRRLRKIRELTSNHLSKRGQTPEFSASKLRKELKRRELKEEVPQLGIEHRFARQRASLSNLFK